MTVNRVLLIVGLVLFLLAALAAGGVIDPDPAVLRWQVLACLGLASTTAAAVV